LINIQSLSESKINLKIKNFVLNPEALTIKDDEYNNFKPQVKIIISEGYDENYFL